MALILLASIFCTLQLYLFQSTYIPQDQFWSQYYNHIGSFKPYNTHNHITADYNSSHGSTAAFSVSCPHGWKAVGPLCITYLQIQAHTECPFDYSSLKPGYKSKLQVVEPGVCQHMIREGPIPYCFEGFRLHKLVTLEGTSLECRRNLPTLSVPKCPKRFAPIQNTCDIDEETINVGYRCEGNKRLGMRVSNVYYPTRKSLECIETIKFKGRLWCPEGFILQNEPFSQIKFNGVIPVDAPKNDQIDDLSITMFDDNFQTSDTNLLVFQEETNGTVSCVQRVAVNFNNCNRFECNHPITRAAKKTLKNWGYMQLFMDPTHTLNTSVPSGKDIMVTMPGWGKKHPY